MSWERLVMSVAVALAVIASILVVVALFTWIERRLLGLWQNRHGPNRAGWFGVMQAPADVIKLMMKEDWVPPFVDKPVYILAPGVAVVVLMLAFAVVPFSPHFLILDTNIAVLFFLAMASLAVYSVVLGGWSSNSKYALLGGLRAAAQMVSYEVFMGLSLMGVVALTGSFGLREIVAAQNGLWFCVPQVLGLATFYIAGIAQAHRLPFDLPEAENELGAGYHTEYSGLKFGFFFLGEYLAVLVIAAFTVTLFFGGWRGPVLPPWLWFLGKTAAVSLSFVLLRAALPRPRYDQLMSYAWKAMLPLALANLLVTGAAIAATS